MEPSGGTPNAPDKLTWWCKANGHKNDPKRCRLFKVPEFHCKCGCGEEVSIIASISICGVICLISFYCYLFLVLM